MRATSIMCSDSPAVTVQKIAERRRATDLTCTRQRSQTERDRVARHSAEWHNQAIISERRCFLITLLLHC